MAFEISGDQLILSGRCTIREVESLHQVLLAREQELDLDGQGIESIDTPYLQHIFLAYRSGRVSRVDRSEAAARRAGLLGLNFSSREKDNASNTFGG